MKVCPECGGDGEYLSGTWPRTCPTCNGTGEAPDEETKSIQLYEGDGLEISKDSKQFNFGCCKCGYTHRVEIEHVGEGGIILRFFEAGEVPDTKDSRRHIKLLGTLQVQANCMRDEYRSLYQYDIEEAIGIIERDGEAVEALRELVEASKELVKSGETFRCDMAKSGGDITAMRHSEFAADVFHFNNVVLSRAEALAKEE